MRIPPGKSGAVPGGVEVQQIVSDPTRGQQVYDPSSPDANAQGYVTMPNVNTVTEMTDLIDESNAYQANVTAMQTAKSMFTSTLQVLPQHPVLRELVADNKGHRR